MNSRPYIIPWPNGKNEPERVHTNPTDLSNSDWESLILFAGNRLRFLTDHKRKFTIEDDRDYALQLYRSGEVELIEGQWEIV